MAYRLKSGDKTLTKTLRRVARDQLDKAIAAIGDETGATLPATVHDVRKRTKKTRGLLRLVRPALPAYSAENRALREAALRLSPLRDRGTLIEAYDALFDRYPDEPRQPYAPLRAALTLRHKAVVADPGTFDQLYAFRDDLAEVRARTGQWKLTETDEAAITLGLVKTYARAQKAMARARKRLTEERLHEWRKRVKYHRYHTQILAPIWPEMMAARLERSHHLEDLLGEYRDLTLLAEEARTLERPADMSARAAFTGLVERRQAAILAEAVPLSERLFREPAKALAARWTGWYAIWSREG